MKPRWSVPALSAFFVAAALIVAGCGSSSGSSSSIPAGAVANVAGNPISTQAFNHWLYIDAKGQQLPLVPNDPPNFTKCVAQAKATVPQLKTASDTTIQADCKQLFTSLAGQVMDFLIKAYWYQGLAHTQGISLTPAEISTELTKEKKQQFKTDAAYTSFLKQSGQTQADINYRVRISQIVKKLVAKQPTKVTSADIAAYYKAHRSAFGTPEHRNMRIVLAKNASRASAALKALKGGQSWNVVAKKYSTDPTTRNKGGLLTDVSAGQQDAALSKAAFAAPANKLEGPIKGQFGYYVLDVIKITPSTQRSLKQSSAQIKQTLTSTKQKAAQTAVDDMAKKAYGSRTLCKAVYSMADCKGYKPPATPTTPATPGATTPAPPAGATTPAPGAATGTATAPPASSSSSSSSSTTSSSGG